MSNYRVWWNSPRGFANEGDYVYGSTQDVDALLDGTVHCALISKHLTRDAAKNQAERLERKDRKACPSHEICSYGVIDAAYALIHNNQ